MLAPLRQRIEAQLDAVAAELLGDKRRFIATLEVESLAHSVVRLRATRPSPTPTEVDRLTCMIRDGLSATLGVAVDVRILAARPQPRDAAAPPLVDAGNRTAHLMFEALLEGQHDMNPAFVHGVAGSGKTHLLESFLRRSEVPASAWDGNGLYETVSRLARRQGLYEWRASILGSRLFVVDELHRVAGKRRTQQELCALIDEFKARQAQVVFLSRHHPRQIRSISATLRSRLLGGFTVQIGSPLKETRIELLARHGIDAAKHPDLVKRVTRGPRTFGDIMRLIENHRRRGCSDGECETFVEDLLARVASRFGTQASELIEPGSSRRLCVPRQVAVFVAREAGISGAEMARRFGWSSASTASYAVRRVRSRMTQDAEFRRLVQSMM